MHFPDKEYSCGGLFPSAIRLYHHSLMCVSEVLMPPAVFVEMCGELNVIGEKLTFELKDGALTLSGKLTAALHLF